MRRSLLIAVLFAGLLVPQADVWANDDGAATITAGPHSSAYSRPTKGYRTRRITRDGRYRSGFTIQLGAGIGFQRQQTENVEPFTSVAVGGLNVGVGAFIERSIALMLRVSGSIAFPPPETFASPSVAGVFGAAAQFWPTDWLKLELGFGLAYQRVERRELEDVTYSNLGVGVISSVAFRIWQRRNHSLQLGVTYTPLFVPGAPVQATSLNLIYQFL